MLSNNEILNTHTDLLDIYFQLEAFDTYVNHLESHIVWPQKIEEQSLSGISDPQEHMAAMDDIEYKYVTVLPIRQRFSYVLQFTSIMEWSLKRTLDHYKISYKSKVRSTKKDKEDQRGEFEILLDIVEDVMEVKIVNKGDLLRLYKFRNNVVHSNGIVSSRDSDKFKNSNQYSLKNVFGENYLFLNLSEFLECIKVTRHWLSIAIAFNK